MELNRIDPKDDPAKFFHFVKIFFANYFRIKYEYTYEELEIEIDKRKVSPELKKDILSFSDKMSSMAYGGDTIQPKDMKKAIDEFRLIVDKLVKKKIPAAKRKKEVAEEFVKKKFIDEEKRKCGKERLLALRAKYAFDKLKTKIVPKKLDEAQVKLNQQELEREQKEL